MPSRRLLLAFAASLLLHAAALGGGALGQLRRPAPPPMLQVALRPPPPPVESLIKNTLEAEAETPREPPPAPPPAVRPERPAARAAAAPKPETKQIRAAQKKLAEHTFYPPEAIARGLEGTIHVLVVFTDDGRVADVQLAASSGHAILDNAALKAAWAIGSVPGVTVRQLILPVSFRLR